MPETRINCSSCGAVLKLNAPVPQGKSVKCPKCGERLLPSATGHSGVTGKSSPSSARAEAAPRPKPAARKVEEPPEELDEEVDEREEEEAPRKRASQPRPVRNKKRVEGRRRKREEDQEGGNKKLLWVGLGGGGVLIAGIIILVVALTRSKDKDNSVASRGGSPTSPSLPGDKTRENPPPVPEQKPTPVSRTTVVGAIDTGLKKDQFGAFLGGGNSSDTQICLSADGTVVSLYAAKASETLRLFDVATGKRLSGVNMKGSSGVGGIVMAISPDNTLIAYQAFVENAAVIRDIKTGGLLHRLTITEAPSYFYCAS